MKVVLVKKYIALLCVILAVATFPFSSFAAQLVSFVRVEGNQRVEVETIYAYMAIHKGDVLDDKLINQSLKKLFDTGLFEDVTITKDNGGLLVKVVENPIINEVKFEGNKRIEDDALKAEISLYPRAVYSKSKVRESMERILAIYRKSGRFSVDVNPKLEKLDQNRVNLVFEIDEGPKTVVRRISFVGNKKFSDRALAKAIQTKEKAWYRFFSGNDTYDEDRLVYDKELLRKFYVTRGYADFQVSSTIVELTPEKDAFFITFIIAEGEKYNFGDIKVTSEIANMDVTKLTPVVTSKEGEVFNAERIENSIEAMTNQLSDQGYAFINIDPRFQLDHEKRTVSIDYMIKEGAKVYVNKINIRGNVRTLDEVIRREFRLEEGDPYNAAKIRRSRDRIRNLNFFEKVDIENARIDDMPDKVDLDVKVSEKSTGELNFGAGFSTSEGALANASIRERNLLGRGQDLRFNVQTAQKSLQTDIGFTEPYFMGKEIAAGFDLFHTTRDLLNESSYKSQTEGGTLRATYAVSEYLQHALRYSARSDNVTDVSPFASRFVREQEGQNITSLVGHSLIYDKRDNKFETKEGYYLRFNQDFAGLGGDSRFIRNELRGAYYRPVIKDSIVMQLSAKAGNIFGWGGKDVRISDRFFVGGDDLRGFKRSGIGPRDITTGDALGGNNYYTFGAETTFPLGLPEELGLKGALFMDAGSLFDVDANGPEVVDKNSLRMAVGTGIAWGSPLGPLRIDIGFPIMQEKFDKEQKFRFSFGTRF